MPTFAYVVKDRSGNTIRGTLESASRNAIVEQLWKQSLIIISVDEQSTRRSAVLSIGTPRVPISQLVIFSRQLATMVDSGIPIVSGLDILAEQIEDRHFQSILKRLRGDVETGSSLSEAIARHPQIFSGFFINMVRVGESSGKFAEILDRVATYLEKTENLQRKVKTSLFYPAFVSVLAFGITAFLVVVIVPKFKDIFVALGGQLPAPTQFLLAVSDWVRQYLVLEVAAGIGGVVLFQMALNTPRGRLAADRLLLRLPIVGKLLQKVVVARFARTLATLVKSGVPILGSLEIVAKTAGNKVIERAVLAARASIREGETIADPLAHSRVFPPHGDPDDRGRGEDRGA